jgi:hypothetical protein
MTGGEPFLAVAVTVSVTVSAARAGIGANDAAVNAKAVTKIHVLGRILNFIFYLLTHI